MYIKRVDLTGQRFGYLVVKEMLYNYGTTTRKRTFCKCKCDCGNEKIINVDNLKRNPNISCGCKTKYFRTVNNRTNEIGKKYNRLTIIDIDYSTKPSKAKCVCDCGNIITATKADVVSGHTKSCGCLQADRASESNTRDFSGVKSSSGVIMVSRSYQNDKNVWFWKCICPLCGNTFDALPAKVLSNHTTSCGCKIQSSKARIIETYLSELGVKYEREKRFDDCKYKYTLPFDFAVYSNSGELELLIEYDGKQHFEPVEFFGGDKGFNKCQTRDKIKTQYCKDNNIKLLRFDYRDSDDYIYQTISNTIYP